MDKRETHILIIWPNSLPYYQNILEEILPFFQLEKEFEIYLNQNRNEFLKKFYARSLAHYNKHDTKQILKEKKKQIGKGKAKILKITTENINYKWVSTTNGISYVNTTCADVKQKLRNFIKKDFHLSDSLSDSQENQYHLNLIKNTDCNSIVDFFKFLNEKNIPYVSMRGHQFVRNEINKLIKHQKDIDLLVHKDYFDELRKYPFLVKRTDEKSERHSLSFISASEYHTCKIDIYKTGSGIIPPNFEEKILSDNQMSDGIKILTPLDTELLDIYHKVFHKRFLPNNTSQEQISKLLDTHNLNQVIDNPYYPNWNSLPDSNRQLIQNRLLTTILGKRYFSYVFKNDKNQIIKEGNLKNIKNEYSILKILNKDLQGIIPSPINIQEVQDDDLGILTMSKVEGALFRKMPNTYWNFKIFKKHLNSALNTLKVLKKYKIQHRDINPSNILFTQRDIKFIDFGWSISKKSKIETPEGLNSGFYKHPERHDDLYSLIKCFETKYILPPFLKKILRSYNLDLIQNKLNSLNIIERIIIDLFLRNQRFLTKLSQIKNKII